MKEFQEKQKLRRRMYSLPVLIILLLICFAFIKGTYAVLKKERESAHHVVLLEKKSKELHEREEMLKENMERLKTDEGIDEEIKEKFSVSREGEQVAIIVEPLQNRQNKTSTSTSFLSDIWRTISGLWH